MYYLISIQGKYAAHYRFKEQSAQSFKDLIQGITGNCCAVISSRFRTDLIYCSDQLAHKEALKLWAIHIKEELTRQQRHLFIFKSGKEEVLQYYFSSLNKLYRIQDWYGEYVEEFNHLFNLDKNNPVLQVIVECDHYLVSHDLAHNRSSLLKQGFSPKQPDDGKIISILKEMVQKKERNN